MNTSELIERHEEKRLKPYDDATGKELPAGTVVKGKISIGIGRNLTDVGLSQDEIKYLFNNDLQRAYDACAVYPWFLALSEARKAACIDLAFNLGNIGRFPKFCAAMAIGDFGTAANELVDSAWYKQVGVRGPELVALIRDERWPA